MRRQDNENSQHGRSVVEPEKWVSDKFEAHNSSTGKESRDNRQDRNGSNYTRRPQSNRFDNRLRNGDRDVDSDFNKKRNRNDGYDDSRSIRPKIMSKIVAVSNPHDNAIELPINNDNETPNNPEVFSKPDVVKRNKRMFGALMGHLDLAKRNLEHDSDRIGRQSKLNALASEKNQLEAKRL
eukprot:gene37509-49090_t